MFFRPALLYLLSIYPMRITCVLPLRPCVTSVCLQLNSSFTLERAGCSTAMTMWNGRLKMDMLKTACDVHAGRRSEKTATPFSFMSFSPNISFLAFTDGTLHASLTVSRTVSQTVSAPNKVRLQQFPDWPSAVAAAAALSYSFQCYSRNPYGQSTLTVMCVSPFFFFFLKNSFNLTI